MPDGVSPTTADSTTGLRVSPWASLAYRDYRLLWISAFFMQIAQQMRQLTNFYLVYQITGSTVQLGLTGLFQLVPMLVLGLFGGTLADLLDRKKLILVTMFVGFLLPLILWALTATDLVRVWHIFGIVTATSLINVFGGPARLSMLARTVPQDHLMNAVTINTGTMQMTMLAGPLIAGFLILWIGVAGGYLISAILFAPAIAVVLLIRTSGAPEGARESPLAQGLGPFSRTVFSGAWEGARFIWSQKILMSIFLLDLGVTVVSYFRPLLAAFAADVYDVGAASLGTITAVLPLGSILGATFLLLAGGIKRKGLLVLGSTLLYGLCLGLFGSTSSFWLAVVFVGAVGFFDSIAMTIKHATTQIVTPDHLRGRASSAVSMASMTANALGTVEVGLVAAYLGPQDTILLGAAICIGVVLMSWITMRTLREYQA